MTQYARPASLTTTDWNGAYTDLADADDATYIESGTNPIATETFVCALGEVEDPSVDTGHQIRVRAVLYPSGAQAQQIVLALENTDDDSVVAIKTYAAIPSVPEDEVLTLSEAEVSDIHSYSGLRIRGYAAAYGTVEVAFVWNYVLNADHYVLQVRPSGSGVYSIYNASVGLVLTYALMLNPGTYYSRVIAYQGAAVLNTTDEQSVTVT